MTSPAPRLAPFHRYLSAAACLFAGILPIAMSTGCSPEYNWRPPKDEAQVLTSVTQLTRGTEFEKAGEAYFSSDMRWVIFQGTPRGEQHYQLYLAPIRWEEDVIDGARITPLPGPITNPAKLHIAGLGRPIRISPPDSRNTCGYFSPDTNSLIFASTAGKEDPTLRESGYQPDTKRYEWQYPPGMEIFRADGWQGAISAVEPGTIVDLAKHPLTNNAAYDAECAFSPDGKWIVFCSNRRQSTSNDAAAPASEPAGDLDLYVMHPDGSGVVQLTHTPGYDGGPFFSPDGKRIVYRSDRRNNGELQIYTAELVFDRSGNITGITHETALTRDEFTNWGPYWHPDGQHIIYATSRHGHSNYELYLMRADGSHKTRVTFTDGADVLPVFSPDARYLLWASKRTDDKSVQVFVAKFKMPKGV
jgi:TolB protein